MNYAYNPYSYANGGLASVAERLRQQGRGGDTMLAHINPQEAGILKALGGSGTINPRTGLPEFLKLRDLDPTRAVKSIGRTIDDAIIQPVIGAANDIAEALGPVGQIAAAYFGGPIGAAIYAGFAAPGDDFNLKRAATAGALTYGAGQLMGGGMGFEGTPTPGGGVEMGYPNIGGDVGAASSGIGGLGGAEVSLVPPPDATISNIPATVEPPTTPMSSVSSAPSLPPLPQSSYTMEELLGPTQGAPTYNVSDTVTSGGPQGVEIIDRSVPFDPNAYNAISAPQGIANLTSAVGERAINYAVNNPINTALGATTAYGMYKSAEETKAMREEAERARQAAETKKAEDKAAAEEIMKKYPFRFGHLTAADVSRFGLAAGGDVYADDNNNADGGLMALARGGALPPRFLAGGGDGMSDSIPARIENKQEARLADGEFVVPADVVSHIGNGSSKAGAKKLYAMMDRVRQARTGKTRQAPEINAKRLMPV